jgi:DNA-binding GntR family transcriptional regulator
MKIKTSSGHHETQRERVYHRLKLALMGGDYKPGQKITIAAIATAFGVSATPVREALRRLTTERALVMYPNRSVMVPRLSSEEVLTIRDIRAQLEGYAVRIAAVRVNEGHLERLYKIELALAAARTRRDGRKLLRLNEEFHFAIYEAAGIPVLTDMIATLWLLSGPTLNLLVKPEFIDRYRFAAQNRNNRALVAALRSRDGERAAKALVAEIAEGSRMLGALMQEIIWDAGEASSKRRRRKNK